MTVQTMIRCQAGIIMLGFWSSMLWSRDLTQEALLQNGRWTNSTGIEYINPKKIGPDLQYLRYTNWPSVFAGSDYISSLNSTEKLSSAFNDNDPTNRMWLMEYMTRGCRYSSGSGFGNMLLSKLERTASDDPEYIVRFLALGALYRYGGSNAVPYLARYVKRNGDARVMLSVANHDSLVFACRYLEKLQRKEAIEGWIQLMRYGNSREKDIAFSNFQFLTKTTDLKLRKFTSITNIAGARVFATDLNKRDEEFGRVQDWWSGNKERYQFPEDNTRKDRNDE